MKVVREVHFRSWGSKIKYESSTRSPLLQLGLENRNFQVRVVREVHIRSCRFEIRNPESSFAHFFLLKCLFALRTFWNLRTFEGFAHFSDETPLVVKVGTTCGNN